MKLRSYMRGLGIGIIVSTLLVGFAYRNVSPTMTDEEIKAAAEKLGMVEEDKTLINNSQKSDKVLSESQEAIKGSDIKQDKTVIEKDDSETKAEADKKTEADNKSETNNEANADNKANVDNKAESDKKAEADNDTGVDNKKEDKTDSEPVAAVSVSGTAVSHDVYVITIAKGSGSDTVSRLLEMGGLVKSSQDFDQYLCNNGYDSRIVEGDHSIPADASYEEIAKIITTRE